MAYVKGYSRAHPGKYALVIDWETSGSTFGGDSSVDHQGLSFGAVIADTSTWEPVETLYVELHFDETKYKWTDKAQEIHGLSREHLAANGVPREEALAMLIELLLKYFAPGSKIMLIGHNAGFDADFTFQLFRDFGLLEHFNLHHVMPDSSALAFVLIGDYKSDIVFEKLAFTEKRKEHNALDDALICLTVLRNAKQIFQAAYNPGV